MAKVWTYIPLWKRLMKNKCACGVGEEITSAPPPNPGTPEALALGCTCPVVDNGYGTGYRGRPGEYIYSVNCPLHGIGR